MKLSALTASLIIGIAPVAWAADVPYTNPYLSTAPAQGGVPANTFNWFNPYAWMALMTPQPAATPAQAAAPTYPQAVTPTTTFNWFDPNAWTAMFFAPAAWIPPQPAAGPGAQPAVTGSQATAYPANSFNWFDPNAWATFFNPAAWAAQPAAVSGK